MGEIDLSIIIVSYNTKNFLEKCLESVQQSFTLPECKPTLITEIIVADNGSTDGSVEMLKKLQTRAAGKAFGDARQHSELRTIFNKTNLGFAAANNIALRHPSVKLRTRAQGRYILFLNPDTLVQGGTLKIMVKFMDENPKVGAATCRVELANGQLDQACHRGFPTVWNSFCYFSGLEKLFPKSRIFAGYSLTYLPLNKIHEIDAGCGAFLIVRHQAGKEINWFDEDYFWYGEDLDFCYRLKQNGWKIMFVPTTKIIHWKGAASGIKKHSQNISTANKETKIRAAEASIEVMRIFFQKHYKDKYPKFIYWLTMLGINLLEKIRLTQISSK